MSQSKRKRAPKKGSPPRVLNPATMWAYARNYLGAAHLLLMADPLDAASFFPVLPHALGHCIEVSLKAFLCARGLNEQELRDRGHDLIALLSAAERRRLNNHVRLSARERRTIAQLNRLYRDRDLVYASSTAGQLVRKTPPSARRLLAIAGKLHAGVAVVCRPTRRRPTS